MVKYKVTLIKEERETLMADTREGSHQAKKVIHSSYFAKCRPGVPIRRTPKPMRRSVKY